MTASRRTLAIALLLLGLVAVAVLRSAAGTRLDSYTIDEPWHAVAGAAYAQHGDYALNPEHPPLVKRWVGEWLGRDLRVGPTPPLREKHDEREYVERVMYQQNDDRAIQAGARRAMWAFHALLLAAIGFVAWRALGAPWAVGLLAFLAVDPSVGAYLPVVMTDLPVALTLLLAALLAGLLLATWRWHWAVALGVALGLAWGSKHSALPGLAALGAFALAGWLWQVRGTPWRERGRRAAQLALAFALALGTLWAQYDFRFHPRPDGSDGFNRDVTAKIDDLRSPRSKALLHLADQYRVLPRAYLWGLADTVRAGMEGRGEPGVFLWGRFHDGTPWFTWPSLVASKLPLALMAMALLGAIALLRAPLTAPMRWTLLAVTAMAAGYGAALANAHSAYAGLRHAMPLVAWLAVLAGALAWRAWQARAKAWRALPVLLVLAALAMTLREPRLWEYHNELAGGTAGAPARFANESVELGQRLHEAEQYFARHIAPHRATVYLDNYAYAARAWREARGLPMRKRVESIHDDNREGLFEGWFLKDAGARVPAPWYDYDPAEALQGLQPVQRIGNIEFWRGSQRRPKSRDWPLFGRISEYVYVKGGTDWALVAERAQEIVDRRPGFFGAAIELGNARLRLGQFDAARAAYAGVLEQQQTPVPELVREMLQKQVDRLSGAEDLAKVEPLRNPMME